MTYAGLDKWIQGDPDAVDYGEKPLTEREQMLADAEAAVGEPIHVHYEHPPIPIRTCDWVATLDSYDGAPDAGSQYMGFGRTEEEAVADLVQQVLDDRDPQIIWSDGSQFGMGA